MSFGSTLGAVRSVCFSVFVTARSRAALVALLMLAATVPVLEVTAVLGFATLTASDDSRPAGVGWLVALLVAVLAFAYGGRYALWFIRPRVFDNALEDRADGAGAGTAPDVTQVPATSQIVVAGAQLLALTSLFLVLDPDVGLAALVVNLAVLALAFHRGNRASPPERRDAGMRGSTAVAAWRLEGRIALPAVAMVLVLAVVIARTLSGATPPETGFALFLGLWLLVGLLATLQENLLGFGTNPSTSARLS